MFCIVTEQLSFSPLRPSPRSSYAGAMDTWGAATVAVARTRAGRPWRGAMVMRVWSGTGDTAEKVQGTGLWVPGERWMGLRRVRRGSSATV